MNGLGKALEACADAEIFLEALGASDPVISVPADGYCGFRRGGSGSPYLKVLVSGGRCVAMLMGKSLTDLFKSAGPRA